MSILASAKNKAAKGDLKGAFVNEAGAIDLASIMVGIIVIGLIGGVIAATVFAVIPWAQDNAAKQQLDAVVSAQSAYIGLSADGGAVSFGTAEQLNDPATALFNAEAAGVSIITGGTGDDASYAAVKVSTSGNGFFVWDGKTQPTLVETTSADTALVETQEAAVADSGIDAVANTWSVLP